MSDPVFWALVSVAALSWGALVCRWLLHRSGLDERFAVWRWRRQDRVRRT